MFCVTGMTSWACLSPKTTLLVVSPSPLIIMLFYYFLDKEHVTSHSRAVVHPGIQYSSLSLDSDSSQKSDSPAANVLSWEEKFRSVKQIMPWILSLSVAYIAQYLTIQSVFTTIAFQHAPFEPRDHYIFYVLLNNMGEFFTRSYLSVISCAKPALVPRFVIKQTWILSFLLVCITATAVCASWYRFIHNVGVLLFLSFTVGALSGSVYSSTVCAVPEIVEPRYQEFCLGIVTIGESFGALLASILGFYIEPALRRHCATVSMSKLSECITRPPEQRWNVAACKVLNKEVITAPLTTDI